MDNISQAFRDYNQPDPRIDVEGKVARLLQMQLKGYKEADPEEKHQKAISFSVLRKMNQQAVMDLDKAIAILCIGAMFFCMRSCQYSKVQSQEDRRTKLLCVRKFRFFKDMRELNLKSDDISRTDLISITFEDQKAEHRKEQISKSALF